MASKITIKLDTSKENYLVAKCKQNDDLTLEAFIYENGLALDITNKEITIQALKADNTYIIQNRDISKKNNKISANLVRDFSRVPGTTKIEIVLIESGKQNTTFSFYLEVVGSVIKEAMESSNTVTILENLQEKIIEAGAVKAEAEKLIQTGGAATKGDIKEVNAHLADNNKDIADLKKDIGATANIEELKAVNNEATKKIVDLDIKLAQVGDISKTIENVEGAKNDFDGGKHNSLNERLKSDLDKVYDRFNNASLLEYEGEYITANNSYDGFTKDLSIKGRTLQNIIKNTSWVLNDSKNTAHMVVDWSLLKPNTKYTYILFNLSPKISKNQGFIGNNFTQQSLLNIGQPVLLTSVSDLTIAGNKYPHIYPNGDTVIFTAEDLVNTKIMLLEGDWTNKPILQFFEGIQSVGETEDNKIEILSCGKNLFDKEDFLKKISKATNSYSRVTIEGRDCIEILNSSVYPIPLIEGFEKGKRVTVQFEGKFSRKIRESGQSIFFSAFYKSGKTNHGLNYLQNSAATFTKVVGSTIVGESVDFLTLSYGDGGAYFYIDLDSIQIEYGDVVTAYEEPRIDKSQILLKEPLRGLSETICDEVVKNHVVRRIQKEVFDGGENKSWFIGETSTETTVNFLYPSDKVKVNSRVVCDRFPNDILSSANGIEGVLVDSALKHIKVEILKSKLSSLDSAGFKKWLQTNPVTVYYELATPVIEELSNPIKLRTFDKTTHMFSNHLIQPHISTRVPSDVNSVIKTLKAVNDRLSMIVKQNNLNTIALNVDQEARLTALELGVIGR